MANNVTDRVLLKFIYDQYYSEFCSFEKGNKSRCSKIYVPIDCKYIAKKLKLDHDIVFGRLYYNLEKKYGYKRDDGARVHLFALKAGTDRYAVNFPHLSGVVAELEQSYSRFTLSLVVSTIAIIISLFSLLIGNG